MKAQPAKVGVLTILAGAAIFVLAVFFDPASFQFKNYHNAVADTATTTVTVLNIPPQWDTDAQEYIESSTSSPTNVGSQVVWVGKANDPNNDPYYLLVCKTSTAPTPRSSQSPVCAGGASQQWGVSSLTNTMVQATTTYAALSTDPEQNDWYAFICDSTVVSPRCNSSYKQGTGSMASPFFVNHQANFTSAVDTSPSNPSDVVTWTTTASDPDVVTAADQVKLFVCKANDFTGSACGAGGAYCTTTLVNSNPTCSTTLPSVLSAGNWTAYTYITDNHNLVASGTAEATNTVLAVNNMPPVILSSSINLFDTDGVGGLSLTVAQGQTTGFQTKFTVSDQNGCSSSFSGQPDVVITSTILSVYRSGIGQAGCQTSGNYNPNSCYTSAAGNTTWSYYCSQDAGSCTGADDPTATFTCIFPLWYIADPTDGTNSSTDTVYYNQNWQTSVQVTDVNGSSSNLVEAAAGNEMLSFWAFDVPQTAISYGALQPGSSTDPLAPTTTVIEQGNFGLDETIYGDHMCTTYPTCSPSSTTSTIQIYYQKYATSAVGYASSSAFAATSTSSTAPMPIHVLKSTQTSTPAFGTTFWGVLVPGSLMLAGDYTGQNTIIGVKSSPTYW